MPTFVCPSLASYPGIRPYWHRAYRQMEIRFWDLILGWIRDFVGTRCEVPVCRLLNVGGAYGTLGEVVVQLTGAQHVITDYRDFGYLSKTMRRERHILFKVANLQLDPIPLPPLARYGQKEGYDIILFTEVIEHLPFHPEEAMRKLAGALAPGGRLYLSARLRRGTEEDGYERLPRASRNSTATIRAPRGGHHHEYTEAELFRVVQRSGWTVLRYEHSRRNHGQQMELTIYSH